MGVSTGHSRVIRILSGAASSANLCMCLQPLPARGMCSHSCYCCKKYGRHVAAFLANINHVLRFCRDCWHPFQITIYECPLHTNKVILVRSIKDPSVIWFFIFCCSECISTGAILIQRFCSPSSTPASCCKKNSIYQKKKQLKFRFWLSRKRVPIMQKFIAVLTVEMSPLAHKRDAFVGFCTR